MITQPSTSFRQLTPFTPRVVTLNYVAFPLDNPEVIFGNTPQSFTASCVLPGFPSVTVTIPANTYTSFVSQADANAKALAAAEAQAESELICCWSQDPITDTPEFTALSNEYSYSGSDQYGFLGINEIAEDIQPYVSQLHNWTICPTCDFCYGPDVEGITQSLPYSVRWFVKIENGIPVYGKDGITSQPVPADLLVGVNVLDIIYFSISFDQNARPCFALQVQSGQVQVRRYVAGVPTTNIFSGDYPRLWYDGILQPDVFNQDVICFYVLGGNVKARFQRDLFGTVYTIVAPSPAVNRLTKVDSVSFYQYIYFTDTNGSFWLAKSKAYPLPPNAYSDALTSSVAPSSGTYTLVAIPGGSYSDALSSVVAPSDGTYTSPVVDGGTYSDALTSTVAPAGGDYVLVSVDGGTYSDALTSNVAPLDGSYVAISVNGGSYSDSLTSTVSPAGGSYT